MNVSLQSVATAACFNEARPIKDTCTFLQYYATRVIGEQLKHWGTAWLHESHRHSERNYRLACPQWHIVKPTRLKECNNPHSYLWHILGPNIWTNIGILSLRHVKVSLSMQCLVNLKITYNYFFLIFSKHKNYFTVTGPISESYFTKWGSVTWGKSDYSLFRLTGNRIWKSN